MADIKGIENLSVGELHNIIADGGKFVLFPYCVSVLIMTFRRSSDIYLIRRGESALAKGWGFAVISLFFGWWGFPWGLIWTPMALFQTLAGGKDVTQEVMASIQPVAAPNDGAPPVINANRNPWAS